MVPDLSAAQREARASYRAFALEHVAPRAGQWDRAQALPAEIIAALGHAGMLGCLVPYRHGGTELGMIEFGLLNEELGRACSSVRSVVTVHSMVCHAISRWGTAEQQARWLAPLASGAALGAFALSEPEVGSDAGAVACEAGREGDDLVLRGTKRWITLGQIADLFLVFVRLDDRPTALLVERAAPGLTVEPIRDLLGTRASMLAELTFDGCRVPVHNLVGPPGFGIAAVATSALDIGRYSVAWGCVGIAQACLDACLDRAASRRQFGAALAEHQLVRRMLADMIAQTSAARLLCLHAGHLKQAGDPSTVMETFIAKYYASTAAMRIAVNAVQLHGASGCSADQPVERYLRDAKVMEIIEGSNEIQQIAIADYGLRGAR